MMISAALTTPSVFAAPAYRPEQTSAHAHRSATARDQLLDAAYRRIVRYRSEGLADPIALGNAWLAINYFVRDDAATPQVGLDGEGGVETEWLVDGRSLIVNSLADGTNVLWALADDGHIPFRTEFTPRFMSENRVVAEAQSYLDDISQRVANRFHG